MIGWGWTSFFRDRENTAENLFPGGRREGGSDSVKEDVQVSMSGFLSHAYPCAQVGWRHRLGSWLDGDTARTAALDLLRNAPSSSYHTTSLVLLNKDSKSI